MKNCTSFLRRSTVVKHDIRSAIRTLFELYAFEHGLVEYGSDPLEPVVFKNDFWLVLSNILGISPTDIKLYYDGGAVPSITTFFYMIHSLNCCFVITDFDRRSQFTTNYGYKK